MIKGKFGRAFPIVISSEVEKSFFIEILRQAQNDKEDAQNDKERAGFFGKLRKTKRLLGMTKGKFGRAFPTVISSEVEKSFFIEILRQAQNDKEDAQNDKEDAWNDKERARFFGKLRMTKRMLGMTKSGRDSSASSE